jgi:hypothetical protein
MAVLPGSGAPPADAEGKKTKKSKHRGRGTDEANNLRRQKRRHPYQIITTLKNQLDELTLAQTLDMPEAFSEKAIAAIAMCRNELELRTEAAMEKWGANWLTAALADFRATFGSDVFTIFEESEPESETSTVPVGPGEEREEPDDGGAAGGNAADAPSDKPVLPTKDTPGVERVDLEASPEEPPDRHSASPADVEMAPAQTEGDAGTLAVTTTFALGTDPSLFPENAGQQLVPPLAIGLIGVPVAGALGGPLGAPLLGPPAPTATPVPTTSTITSFSIAGSVEGDTVGDADWNLANTPEVGGPSVFATPLGTTEVGGGNAPTPGAPSTQPAGATSGAAAAAVMAIANAAAATLAAQSLPGADGTRVMEAFDVPPNVLTSDIRVCCWIAALLGIFFLVSALALASAFMLGWVFGKKAGIAETSRAPLGPPPTKVPEPLPTTSRGRIFEGNIHTTRFGELWHSRRDCRHLQCATLILDRKPCYTCTEADLADTPVAAPTQ